MGEGGCNGSESEAIGHDKEPAQVEPSTPSVGLQVKFEVGVDDGFDVVACAVVSEEFPGVEGEGFGVGHVEAPVTERNGEVAAEGVADEDVGDGEEGGHQRAAEEGGDGGPVEGDGADAEAGHAGGDLLGGDGVGEAPAEPRDAGDHGEEVAGDHVPGEAADEGDDEELGSGDAAVCFRVLLVQRPALDRCVSCI